MLPKYSKWENRFFIISYMVISVSTYFYWAEHDWVIKIAYSILAGGIGVLILMMLDEIIYIPIMLIKSHKAKMGKRNKDASKQPLKGSTVVEDNDGEV